MTVFPDSVSHVVLVLLDSVLSPPRLLSPSSFTVDLAQVFTSFEVNNLLSEEPARVRVGCCPGPTVLEALCSICVFLSTILLN